MYPQTHKILSFLTGMRRKSAYVNVMEALEFDHPTICSRQHKRKLSSGLDNMHVFGDEDRNFETCRKFEKRIKLDKEQDKIGNRMLCSSCDRCLLVQTECDGQSLCRICTVKTEVSARSTRVKRWHGRCRLIE